MTDLYKIEVGRINPTRHSPNTWVAVLTRIRDERKITVEAMDVRELMQDLGEIIERIEA